MDIKFKTTKKYTLTKSDLKKVLADGLGINEASITSLKDVVKTEEIPLGMFDCDYVDVFDGIEIVVEE